MLKEHEVPKTRSVLAVTKVIFWFFLKQLEESTTETPSPGVESQSSSKNNKYTCIIKT